MMTLLNCDLSKFKILNEMTIEKEKYENKVSLIITELSRVVKGTCDLHKRVTFTHKPILILIPQQLLKPFSYQPPHRLASPIPVPKTLDCLDVNIEPGL